MPRKDWNEVVESKIQKYLAEYDLDALNEANDLAAIRQMCTLEAAIEKQTKQLLSTDPKNVKAIKGLQSSVKDATNAWATLQQSLRIDRRRRKEEGTDHKSNAMLYVEWLRENVPKFIDSRYKFLICPNCTAKAQQLAGDDREQIVGKYLQYVTHEGEFGSIESEKKPPRELKFTIRMECPFCHTIVEQSNEKGVDVKEKIKLDEGDLALLEIFRDDVLWGEFIEYLEEHDPKLAKFLKSIERT